MYTNEFNEDKNKFPIKDFLIKLFLVIAFILLLMWLIPWPSGNSTVDRVFGQNLDSMKNASILYYTSERLPVNVGDKKTMTLREMLELKLILPFTDKDGNTCDVDNSYVMIEKLSTEFLMKIYLKCGKEENYILVHVGCYSYCQTYLCEKKPTPTATPKPKPKPTATPKPTPTQTPKPGVIYEYEYKKDISGYTNWLEWSKPIVYVDADNIPFQKTAILEIVKHLEQWEKVGTRTDKITYTKTEPVHVGERVQTVCTERTYVTIGDKTYEVGNWVSTGVTFVGAVPPAGDAATQWILDSVSTECTDNGGSCSNVIKLTWRKYTRSANSSSSCTKTETRSIPLYQMKTTTRTENKTVNLYGLVKYYKYRRGTLVPGSSTTAWSRSKNDQNYLGNGYYLTGNSRPVK